MDGIGRALIGLGVLLVVVGAVVLAAPKAPWLGRLPGDLLIQRPGFTVFIPLGSCLVVSALLSIVLWVLSRFRS